MIPDDIIDRALADCRERTASANQVIDSIEKDGWRFYEAHGDEQMHDVTEKRLAKQRRIIEQAESLMRSYEKHRA